MSYKNLEIKKEIIFRNFKKIKNKLVKLQSYQPIGKIKFKSLLDRLIKIVQKI